MEPEKLAKLLERAPRVVKQLDDLVKLKAMQARIAETGAETEIYPPDARPALMILIDGKPRGPVPCAMVEQRIKEGQWPDSIQVAVDGGDRWQSYRALATSRGEKLPPPAMPAPRPPVDNPYRPPAARLEVIANVDADWDVLPAGNAIHAGFWRRFAASMVDGLFLYILFVLFVVLVLKGPAPESADAAGLWGVAISGLYFVLLESSAWQATLGKRAMGIKVVNAAGERIGLGRALARWVSHILSSLTLGIGYMLAGWTPRKQALHDMAAGTFVVFKDVEPGSPLPAEPVPIPWYGWMFIAVIPLVFVIGILAAIAIPAYQDYTIRKRVDSVLGEMDAILAVAGKQDCEASQRPASSPLLEIIKIGSTAQGGCMATAKFNNAETTPRPLRQQTLGLFFSPESGQWLCTSTLPEKYLPRRCRGKTAPLPPPSSSSLPSSPSDTPQDAADGAMAKATGDSIMVGTQRLNIPRPEGFEPIASRAPDFMKALETVPGNETLDRYFTPENAQRIIDGEKIAAENFRTFYLQIPKALAGKTVTDNEFENNRDAIETANVRAVQNVSDAHFMGVYRREPWALFFTSKVLDHTADGSSQMLIVSASLMITHQKILYLYASAAYNDESDRRWVESSLSAWADAVRAANPNH
ncbi:MAG: RDD family protein [Azonexus sp.]|nr:RDD family protein [Azonexus sp.]